MAAKSRHIVRGPRGDGRPRHTAAGNDSAFSPDQASRIDGGFSSTAAALLASEFLQLTDGAWQRRVELERPAVRLDRLLRPS